MRDVDLPADHRHRQDRLPAARAALPDDRHRARAAHRRRAAGLQPHRLRRLHLRRPGGQPSGRLVRFMAKRELFDHRWIGPLMRSLHHIEVDRGDGRGRRSAPRCDYLRRARRSASSPRRRSRGPWSSRSSRPGPSGSPPRPAYPSCPVILWGTQRMMTKDHPRDFSRGKTISITVGEPMHPHRGRTRSAETAELHARCRRCSATPSPTTPPTSSLPAPGGCPPRYGGSAPTLEEAARLDAEEKRERAASGPRSARRTKR